MREPKVVLYADDDVDDKAWVQDACQAANTALALEFVDNGNEVLQFLETKSRTELPSLIVLDLNMPELDGRQTLRAIKSSSSYKHIPVAIVTTSSSKLDRDVCQRLGASLFLTKPNTYNEWQDIVKQLEPFVSEREGG